MLLNHLRIFGLLLAISFVAPAKADSKASSTKAAKKKTKKAKPKSELGEKFNIEKVALPEVPEVMLSDKFTTHLLFISRGRLKKLMQHIFPTYETVEKEMAELVEEFKKDYQKLNDEATRQKLSYLMETKQRIARTEENLAARACQEANKELDMSTKRKKAPIFFNVQLAPKESMPDYSAFPELVKFVEALENYIEYKFKETYNNVLDQGVDN